MVLGFLVVPWSSGRFSIVQLPHLYLSTSGCLLVGQILTSSNYRQTTILVQTQAIITQLVFDHSLRIRVKSEAEESSQPDSASVSPPSTGDATLVGDSGSEDATTDNAAQSTTKDLSAKGKSKSPDFVKSKTSPDPSKKNMVGKINNLVTSDLSTLQPGQAFMMMSMSSSTVTSVSILITPFSVFAVPLQIATSVFVLYQLIGWRSVEPASDWILSLMVAPIVVLSVDLRVWSSCPQRQPGLRSRCREYRWNE